MDGSISLRELVDVDVIQSIQDRFAKTVGISSVIFLPDGDALTRFSNPTKFCSLIQSTKEGRRRCFQSFTELSRKAVGLSEPEIMYCFAYGAHFVAPIIIDGERKATMYAGQFRPEKFSPEQLKELEKIAVEIDLDPELLAREATNMRTVGKDVVWGCLHSFFRTVKVIAELGAQALELRQAKDSLQKAHDELEIRVQERTTELTETNKELRREIAERKAAEGALRESEQNFRDMVENLMDGVAIADENSYHIYVNPKFSEITGYSRDELLNMTGWDFTRQEDRAKLKQRMEDRMADKPFRTHYDRIIVRKDGTEVPVEMSTTTTIWRGKKRPMAIIHDITERKTAEEALRIERDNFINILESMDDGVYIVNQQCDIQYVNAVLKKCFGSVGGRKCYKYFHNLDEVCPWCKNRDVLAGKTVRWEWYSSRNQRTYDLIDTPLENPDGSISKLEIFRDITERKQAERSLLEAKSELKHIIEVVPGIIAKVNARTGYFAYCNPALSGILGFSPAELLARPFIEFVHPEDRQTTINEVEKQLKGSPLDMFENRYICKNGSYKWLEWRATAADDKEVIYAAATDITERKRAEDALRESEGKLRSIVEQSGDGIVLADEQGTIIEWNPGQERITGLSRAEVLGGLLWDVQFRMVAADPGNPATYEQIKTSLLKVLETGQSEHFDKLQEIVITRPDGARRVTQAVAFSIKTDKGSMVGAIARDITERKQAEGRLRESEARIRALINAPTDAMILIDSAGIVLAINDAHVRWFKESIDELIGSCIFDLFPSDIAEFRRAQANTVFNTGEPIHFEESQEEKIFNTNIYPVFGAKGKVTAVAVYAQDITEHKRVADALWESEGKLRSIVEQSGDGIVLVDEQGTIIEWNPGQERITGLSRAEVLGKYMWDVQFRMAAADRATPAVYEQVKAGVLKFLETGQSGRLDKLQKTVIKRPDGERRVIQVAIFHIKTDEGFMAGAISRNITELSRAEDALRKSEEKYRALFETAKDAIFLSDEAGKFVDVNQAACESLGYSREELLRLSNREIDADPTGYEAFLKVRNALAEEAIFEVSQQRKDGTLLPVEITGKFFKIDGELLSLAIARDITERKAAEEQIKRSLREKDVLMREMHHRVKNNLQVASSLLSMQARITRSKEAIDVLSKSQSRINTMALIHTKLYESGNLSELNMEEFVGTLSEQLFQSYPVTDTKITHIIRITDRKFPISVGMYVGLIINELISNALQHAFGGRKEGTIEVSLTASDGGRVNLSVSDNGVGLPPGFNINKTGSFGLHLVKILIEDQLQGELAVISDEGATFNMEFDLYGNGGCSHGEDKNTDR